MALGYYLLPFIACILGTSAQQLTVRNPIPTLKVPACGYLQYKIPANTFYDEIDGDTRNLNLTFQNSSGRILHRDYWVNFNAANQTITALVDGIFLKSLTIPTEFNFILTATAKRGAAVSSTVRINLSEKPPNTTVAFRLTFVWYNSGYPPRTIILKRVLDKFAAYFYINPLLLRYTDVYSDSVGFSAGITNCTVSNSKCDEKSVKNIQAQLYDSSGTLPEFRNAMLPDIYVSFVQVSMIGICAKRNQPVVVKTYPDVMLSACTGFTHKLPYGVFYDEEDGNNVQLSVYKVNGKVPSASETWVNVNSAQNFLYGVVTDRVINEQPPNGYNLTIRGHDSSMYYADAPLIVRIDRAPIKKYYQFTLYLTLIPDTFLYNFIEQHRVVEAANKFFKANLTNAIASNYLGGKFVSLTSSVCTLSKRCDNAAAASIFSKMIQSGSVPKNDFARAFLPYYTLTAVTAYTDPICKQPQNPPVPVINPWLVSATHCGKMVVHIPSGIFMDPEDGNARNLKLELFMNDSKPVPKTSWVQINSTSQVILGMPALDDITANREYKLVATDRAGLNGYLKLRFLFSTPLTPKYVFKLVYLISKPFPSYVEEVSSLLSRIRKFLNDTSMASFGLVKYKAETSDTRTLEYNNCSIPYNPCDVTMQETIKARLFKSFRPTPGLVNALASDFTLRYGTTQNKETCTPGANTPPKVITGLPVLNISVCGVFKYVIPSTTFHDAEDGNTRNLTLILRDSMKKPLTTRSWLDFDATKQEITSVATVMIAEMKSRQSFILTATDKQGLYVPYDLRVRLQGPFAVLQKCQIQILFSADASLQQKSNVYFASKVLQSMTSYFSLSSSAEIGVVDFIRNTERTFSLHWSYCSPKYTHTTTSTSSSSHTMTSTSSSSHTMTSTSSSSHTMTSTSSSSTVDLYGLSNKILKKLFVSGTSLVKSEFKNAFSNLAVLSVKKVFSAECTSSSPIPGVSQLVFNVSSCGYTKIAVDKDWFYDAEDGNSHNLTLKLLDKHRSEITEIGSWINLDNNFKEILMSVQDEQRNAKVKSYTFYITATDSSGKSAEIPTFVNLIQQHSQETSFHVQFEFLMTQRVSYLNDSIFISDTIAKIYSLPKGSDVKIKLFREGNGLHNSASFYWSTCSYKSCQSDLLKKSKDTQGSLSLFNTYKQGFLPKFNLQRYSLSYGCGLPIIPPKVQIKTVSLNITMCSIATYSIPLSMFFDTTDGDTKKMAIHLLDSSMSHVSASSWIQLNTATLTLYAIPSVDAQLYKSQSHFYIQATNSRGAKSHASLSVNVLESPYTSDCAVTLTVERKLRSNHTVDLNVLNRLLSLIGSFYRDADIRIKVLKFTKLSAYSYALTYSNCSFTFATKEAARRGLSESQRADVTAIFAKIVKTDGSVQSSFATHLSELFIVSSIKVSYECIEAPPYPTGVTSLRSYAFVCLEFRDLLSRTLFNDLKDGTNLTYSLKYQSGESLSPNDWLAYDDRRHEVYGMVTADVKMNAPFYGYKYLIVATDSSGRSANISYAVKISSALPYLDVKFTLGFKSNISENTVTPKALLTLSRSIASYLGGDSKADKILIYSYTAWKSLVFGYCSMPCSEAEFMKKASKLQKTVHKSEVSQQFITAVQDTFVPMNIFIDGPKCLSSSSLKITVHRTITFNYSVCGFLDYKIPSNTFTDSQGRTASDFSLSMYQDGKQLTKSSMFQFDSGTQQLYGTIVTSKLQSQSTLELRASHPVSGLSSASPLIIKFPDYQRFRTVSSTLCAVSVQVSTRINPAYSDTYIIRRFAERTAGHLGGTSDQIQIRSYSRSSTYPMQLSISFSHCSWYSMLSSLSSEKSVTEYIKKISTTRNRLLTKSQSNTFSYNQQYYSALRSEFQLLRITANDWCYKPPNKPPKVNITIKVITVIQCTTFTYQIPASAFSDEDGDARSLALQLLEGNGNSLTASSWVLFNATSQTIHGKPTRQAYVTQTISGYKYILRATDRYGLSKTMDVFLNISGTIKAPKNNPPKIMISNYEVAIPSCGIFRQKLPDNFAIDTEDGSMKNLSVSMKLFDGSDLPQNSWIQFDSKTYEIVALPPDAFVNTGMKWSYMITVSDTCGGTASTFIKISTQSRKISYHNHYFTFQSLMTQSTSNLFIQETFLSKIAVFFKESSKQYRVIQFTKSSTAGYFTLKFSNCSIEKHVCLKVHQKIVAQQNAFKASSQNLHSFSSFVSQWFRISSYRNETFYNLDQPPSVKSSAAKNIRVTSCGSYSRDLSSSVFEHRSQNTLIFFMKLADGKPIPIKYPIQLINKTLHVVSMGSSSTGSHSVTLIATDLCGQSTNTTLKIDINIPSRSTSYRLRLQSTLQTSHSSVYYILQFTTALRLHLNNPTYNIQVSSYSRVKETVIFYWTSCSESICNATEVASLRKLLFVTSNTTDHVFLSRLNKTFNNPQITEDNQCNFTSPTTPISNGSLDVTVGLCKKLSFNVPLTAFHDHEDGDASALHLSLLTEQRQALSISNWVQFNRLTHTIYGYPRYSSVLTSQRNFKYTLVANDIQKNPTSSPLSVSITGSLPTITYQLTMHGTINSEHTQPHIDYEIQLIQKIGKFFGDHAINDISFSKQGKNFTFTWSFCNMRVDKCDCYYIKRVQKMLSPIRNFQEIMQPSFLVSRVSGTRHGVCAHPGGPKRLIDKKQISIYAGQTFSYFVQNNHFYDHEDGFTQNLTLYISNYQKQQMSNSSWIKVQNQYICGLVLLSQVQTQEWSTSRSEYNLVARDACGMESTDAFSVLLNTYRATLRYKIHVYINDQSNGLQTSCQKMQTFVSMISSYLNVNSSVIYIYNVIPSNSSYHNNTIVSWSMTNFTEKNCKNETVRSVREWFVYDNGTVKPAFVKHMKSEFNVVKVDDGNSTCAVIPLPLVVPPVKFPLWILILLLILAILFLLCWLCWLCIPRCCAGCCGACLNGCCGCCNAGCAKCCMPGGKYASLDGKSVPGTEGGVLSNARAAPLVNEDKLGMEPDYGDGVMAAPGVRDSSGYESSPDASKVDEDEMQMAPAAAPMSYTQPDYAASMDEMNRGLDDGQSELSLIPSTESDMAPLPNEFDSGVAAMPRGDAESAAVASSYTDDFSSVASTDDTAGGVLARPFVDDEEAMQMTSVERSYAANSYNNLDALLPQSQEPMQVGALALPQTPNVFSAVESTRKVSTTERISVSTQEFLSEPIVTNQSFSRSQNFEEGIRESLVQPVRLQLPEQAPVSADDINMTETSSNRRMSQTRKVSIPLVIESMKEAKPTMAQLSKRRSSRVMIIGDDFSDDEVFESDQDMTDFFAAPVNDSARERRASESRIITTDNSIGSQGRRVSIVRLNEPLEQHRSEAQHQAAPVQLRLMDDRAASQYSSNDGRSEVSNQGGRRVSVVRVSEGSQSAPVQLRLMDDRAASQYSSQDGRSDVSSQGGRRVSVVRVAGESQPVPVQLRRMSESQDGRSQVLKQGGRRISIVSKDGTVTELKNVKIVDGSGSSRRSNFTSNSLRDGYASDYEPQRVMKTRRISLTSHNNDYKDSYGGGHESLGRKVSRSGQMLGYASDSTDSGFVLSRRSQRRKQRKHGIQPRNDERYIENVAEYAQQGTALNNISTAQEKRRSSRAHATTRRSSRDVEMWSSNTTSYRNQGYDSDSFV